MRVRNTWIAVAVVAGVALSGAPAALAQGSQPAAPVVQVVRKPLAANVAARPAAAAQPAQRQIFTPPPTAPAPTPPTVLGEAWARKLRAALEGVKHVLDVEAQEAQQAIRAKDATARSTPPVVPPWRAAWTPATALREAIAQSPVQMTPVSVAPPSESTVDTRGEHATLLGLRVELPWMVP